MAKVVFGLVAAGAAGAVVAACTSSDNLNSGPLPEAGMEAGTEAATDVLTDAAPEAATEAATDAGTDADASGLHPWISPSCCPAFVPIPGDAGLTLTRPGPFCSAGLAAYCATSGVVGDLATPGCIAPDAATGVDTSVLTDCGHGFHVTAKNCGPYHVVEVTNVDATWDSYFDQTTGALLAVTGSSDLCLPNGGGYGIDCKGGAADFVPVVDCSARRDLCAGADRVKRRPSSRSMPCLRRRRMQMQRLDAPRARTAKCRSLAPS